MWQSRHELALAQQLKSKNRTVEMVQPHSKVPALVPDLELQS